MSPVPKRLLTPQEYLARERAAEFRSEFYRGEMFAMAGANDRHNLIAMSFGASLLPASRARGCKVFGSDMKVRVAETGLYTYPDLSIACGEIQFQDEHRDVLLNPCVIVEVLSKSTERRDRGWKFDRYCELPSLVDYVLVSQDKRLVEHYIRQPHDEWKLQRLKEPDSVLRLTAVGCEVALRAIYADVEFGPEEPGEPFN
jgi:Uma2 family endonuclease